MKTIKAEELKGKILEVLEDGTYRVVLVPKRFVPVQGEPYWFVNFIGEIGKCTWIDDEKDRMRAFKRVAFNSEEEAIRFSEYEKLKLSLSREFITREENWYMTFLTTHKKMYKRTRNTTAQQGTVYFASQDDIDLLNMEFGEDWVNSYEFGYYPEEG